MSNWNLKFVEKILGKSSVVDQLDNVPNETQILFKPIITISRDPGSGGRPIAQAVAKKLGFEFFDKKLITEVAKSTKARREIISEIDEKQRTLMEDFVHTTFNPEYISERRYIKHLIKLILALGQRGRVVIVGRGANFVIPSESAYRVRVTAPYRICVARAVQYEGIPYNRAREVINKVTAERNAFVQQYFTSDLTNPKYYDITLNTNFMTIEDAVSVIVHAFKRKFSNY